MMAASTARVLAGLALALLTACERPSQPSDPDLERMLEQPRADRYEATPVFRDRAVLRLPPEGTVPWDPEPWQALPPNADPAAVLALGRERYGVFCAACHGAAGFSGSVVAQNMPEPPPPLRSARVGAMAPEMIYRHIVEGVGRMPSYAGQLGEGERWAVVRYVRALQGAPLENERMVLDSMRATSRRRP